MVLVDTVDAAAGAPTRVATKIALRDVVALAKPRLSAMVLCTTGVGLYVAPAVLSWARACAVLLATAVVVGAANALNNYLERDSDALMRRTRNRPLAARRLEPMFALWLSGGLALAAMVTLYMAANPLTALLSFVAFALYAWVYTPMKRYSWLAVVVGAVPGAIPPLMGWCAATGALSAGGWSLFGLLFFWQLPHFFAIAVYLQEDYARGGLVVLPGVWGVAISKLATVGSAMLLVPCALGPWYVGLAGPLYACGATLAGVCFVGFTLYGMRRQASGRWARRVFFGSIAYLAVVLAALMTGVT